jgi:glycosyltransferase involved in cell wall biosynthesis
MSTPANESQQPLVSIGMPVYNGSAFVGEAISSLLAQTHKNIELVISDNASRDGTPKLLEEWAKRDPRIRIILNPVNRGAAANFKTVALESRGDYFMWASHDDLWAPDFIEANLKALLASPGAICSMGLVESIRDGMADGLNDDTFALSGSPAKNVIDFLKNPGLNSRMYGLYPTHVAKHAAQVTPHWPFDQLITVKALKFGTYVQVPRVLMWRRRGGESSNMPRAVRNYAHGSWLAQIMPSWHYTMELVREPHVKLTPGLIWLLIRQNVMDTLFVIFYWIYENIPGMRGLLGWAYKCVRGRELKLG